MTLLEKLKIPGSVLGCAAAVGVTMVWFGISVKGPGQRIDELVPVVEDMKTQMEFVIELQADMLRGKCLDDDAEKIALQNLCSKCKAMGIDKCHMLTLAVVDTAQ